MASGARGAVSRRETILDAALECFLISSVAGTTIEDVRLRSGASIGSIYHHFGSKERLAAELYLEMLEGYQDSFLAALRSSRSARAGVEGAVHHHIRWVAARPDRASYLFHCREPEVTAASDDAALDLNTRFYTEAAAWLGGQVDRGQIRALPPKLYHALWMGPSLEYARQWLAGRRRHADLKSAETPLAQAAWDALRAP
jgi:AcrR family transcriptional regulator